MLRDDVLEVFEKIPPNDLSKTVLVLKHGASITLDTVIRDETDYMVVRGREAGTNDEERVFFVPYEEVLFIKLDRNVKVTEVKRMYGEKIAEDVDKTDDEKKADAAKPTGTKLTATPPPAAIANDPASIAKQNLLARIRAARSAVTNTPAGS